MPKKKKSNLFSNTSELKVCTLSHDEVWDDTELIQEYETALLEWRQSCQGAEIVSSPEGARYTDNDKVQEAPEIGPWVTVETHAFDPENYTMNPVIGLDEDEFLNMFDLALTDWKEERGLPVTDTNKTDQTDPFTSNCVTDVATEDVQPISITS